MTQIIFEEIRRVNEHGGEFWSSRDLAKALDYANYSKFLNVIERVKKACENSGEVIHNHFVHVDEMVKTSFDGRSKLSEWY